MEKKIEKIYVYNNKEESQIVEKVLIQYIDGSSSYFSLPSFFDKQTPSQKSKEIKEIKKNLERAIKQLSKQDNSSSNYLENNKVIIIDEKYKELKEYMDFQIVKIEQDTLKALENIRLGTAALGLITLSVHDNLAVLAGLGIPINTFVSILNCADAIKKAIQAANKNI